MCTDKHYTVSVVVTQQVGIFSKLLAMEDNTMQKFLIVKSIQKFYKLTTCVE